MRRRTHCCIINTMQISGTCSRTLTRSSRSRQLPTRFERLLKRPRVVTRRILASQIQTRFRASPLEADQSTVEVPCNLTFHACFVQAGDWLMFAFPHNQGFKDESDPALKEALNEVKQTSYFSIKQEMSHEGLQYDTGCFIEGR